ncbi:hypothetical protein AOE57_00295 [Candidatus Riesia pediculicola]|nr:hypothetical protein AOE57_00295 [Candidatus Riesia pediculicola]
MNGNEFLKKKSLDSNRLGFLHLLSSPLKRKRNFVYFKGFFYQIWFFVLIFYGKKFRTNRCFT